MANFATNCVVDGAVDSSVILLSNRVKVRKRISLDGVSQSVFVERLNTEKSLNVRRLGHQYRDRSTDSNKTKL